MEEYGVRVPWSEETEISVLGAMMIDDEARREAVERLEPRDFYREANGRIFAAFVRLNGRGRAGDVTTLADELRSSGDLKAAGGMAYIAQLVDAVPTAANLEVHADRVRELRALRDLQETLRKALRASAEAGPGEAARVLEEARAAVNRVSVPGTLGDVDLVNMAEWIDDPEAIAPPTPVACGMAYSRQVTLLFADPKAGKTTAAIALGAAVSSGSRWMGQPTLEGPVLYVAAEGSRGEILRRHREFGARPEAVDVVVPGTDPVGELRTLMDARVYRLVVLDTLGKWMAPLDVDRWKQSEVDTVLIPLERIIRGSGAALVAVHHANAEGKPIDSTGFAAWADVLRKVEDGTSDRERVVTGRARFSVPELRFRLQEDADESRLVPVDPKRETDERILDFLEGNPDASKRAIRDGVTGSRTEIDRRLESLIRDGVVQVDRSGRGHNHRIRQNPRRNRTATVRHGESHGSTGNGGDDRGSEGSPPLNRVGDPPPRFAEPVNSAEKNDTHRSCACGRRIGPTSNQCVECKRQRREVRQKLPDPEIIVQVGDDFASTLWASS